MPADEPAFIDTLLLRFADLPPASQTRFLDLLNLYLYASPSRRAQLRREWCMALADKQDRAGR